MLLARAGKREEESWKKEEEGGEKEENGAGNGGELIGWLISGLGGKCEGA